MFTKLGGHPLETFAMPLKSSSFNDKVQMRAFNIELLLSNNSTGPVADNWRPTFITANGQTVQVCDNQYYPGNGPSAGGNQQRYFLYSGCAGGLC